LRSAGRTPLLDATPDGAAVYRQHGFVAGFAFERWQRDAAAKLDEAARRDDVDRTATAVADARACDALVALDRSLWDLDRATLLRAFLARPATHAWLAADASGFAVLRAGRRAEQLGPIVAATERAAIALLDRALADAPGAVFIDVPARQPAFAGALVERGFVRQRAFVRMARGDAPALHASARAFALAGPEFG
jgi:hypothetical protein